MELTTPFVRHWWKFWLFMMSKIQNLNGTHNTRIIIPTGEWVVYDVKDTKFEWNSQHNWFSLYIIGCCLWCQRYKIWMELTTVSASARASRLLFMMSKIQNLNGTHNVNEFGTQFDLLFMMSKIQNLNGTHNKLLSLLNSTSVVYDVKDTKFEWNSQLDILAWRSNLGCLWCQRYKIWMELTTYACNTHN